MAPLGISEAAVASLKFKQLHFPTGCHLPNSLWLCVCVCVCVHERVCFLIWAAVFVYVCVCFFSFLSHILKLIGRRVRGRRR